MNTTFLLNEVSKKTSAYLDKILPEVDNDWWVNCVLKYLSPSQIQQLKRRNISSLEELDLAALLRIFTSNWRAISNRYNLPIEVLNYAKELQTIRNRWAHRDTRNQEKEDLYRDYDTIGRFLAVIGDDVELINLIKSEKRILLSNSEKSNKPLTSFNIKQISGKDKLNRSQAFELSDEFLKNNLNISIDKKQFVFSNKVKPHLNWWFEPRYETFKNDLFIALNDYVSSVLYLFKVPARKLF